MAARGKGRHQRARVRVPVKPRVTQPDPAADLDALLTQDGSGDIVQLLRDLVADPQATASARASGARTLAEIEGRIGRHAPPPERPTTDVALLTRAELVSELERLRAKWGAGAG